ncbi:M23 family metallopeptidase [bacterium]|nr:M23 family metallopeptidase [bacterium]
MAEKKRKNLFDVVIIPHQSGGSVKKYRFSSSLLKKIIVINILLLLSFGGAAFFFGYQFLRIQKVDTQKDSVILTKLEEQNLLNQKLEQLENKFNLLQFNFLQTKTYYSRIKNLFDTSSEFPTGGISNSTKTGTKIDFETLFSDKKGDYIIDENVKYNLDGTIELLSSFEIVLNEEIERFSKSIITSYGTIFEKADMLLSTPSIWPVRGWLSSEFGPRTDPFTGDTKFHEGLDIANNEGLPIKASGNGVVTFAGEQGGYGNVIIISHGYDLETRYAHLQRILIKKGDKIKKGDIIAYLGNSGRSSGPHLHYEIRKYGIPVNPRLYILD